MPFIWLCCAAHSACFAWCIGAWSDLGGLGYAVAEHPYFTLAAVPAAAFALAPLAEELFYALMEACLAFAARGPQNAGAREQQSAAGRPKKK